MFKKYEFKRVLTNKALIILITMIFLLGLIFLKDMKELDAIRSNYDSLRKSSEYNSNRMFFFGRLIEAETLSTDPKLLFEYDILKLENSINAINSLDKGQYKEAYGYELMTNIIDIIDAYNPDSSPLNEHMPFLNKVWEEVASGIDFPPRAKHYFTKADSGLYTQLLYVENLFSCYENNIIYTVRGDVNQNTFLYGLMDLGIPLMFMLIIIILSSDSISRQHRMYITRNTLSQPIKRFDYLRGILVSNYLAIVTVLLLVIIVLTLCAGLLSEFRSTKMPMVTTDNQWNRLKIDGMDLDEARSKRLKPIRIPSSNPNDESDDSYYEGIIYEGIVPLEAGKGIFNNFKNIKFISFTQFMLVYLLEMLLFGFFITSLSVFVSSLTDKKSFALVITAVICIILFIIFRLFPNIPNPMLAIKTREIISATSNYTLLSLTIIQLVSISVLLFISRFIFNRKEIVY